MRPLLLRHTSVTSLSIKHTLLLFFRPTLSPCRLIATMSSSNSSPSPSSSRTYADALALLNTLIPNLKIHALFGSKPKESKPQDAITTTATTTTTTTTTTPKPPPADPNLLAIPEMRAWLLRAGLTPDRLSTLSYIHVAGTKGKGSVAALTTSALLSSPSRSLAGRVGTYTSPHLVTPRERIAIDGRPVDQALFAAAFFELWDALSAAPADDALAIPAGSKPFYFRFLTLLALHLFLREGVRSVVLECGIGGEYDATNAVVLPPASSSSVFSPVTAAVITQLGVDHVAMLGDTPEAIAWHKAGVMKPGVATFTRRLDAQPAVMAVLRARAREIGAELVEVPDDDVRAWSGVPGAKLPGADFQKRNQALAALAATRHLQVLEARHADAGAEPGAKTATVPPPPPPPPPRLRDVSETIVDGLREATLRGRHEVIERAGVSWHLDGAHNADSLAEVARWMVPVVAERHPDADFVLVFNQQERDASALLLGLLREMEAAGVDVGSRLRSAVFTRNDRASDAENADVAVQEKCAAAFREAYPGVEALVCRDLIEMKNAIDALAAAAATATEAQSIRVLVTGSMYLVGNVIGLLEPEGLL